jgi:hypothetical protein
MADAQIADLPPRQDMPARPKLVPKETAPAPYGAGYEMISETLGKARDMTREAALQMADMGLHQSQTLIGLQETLLQMAHANMHASFAAAQRILASTTLNEALGEHRRFAQEQVSTLIGQASALRSASARLGGEAAEPWSEQWSKSFARIRQAFGG